MWWPGTPRDCDGLVVDQGTVGEVADATLTRPGRLQSGVRSGSAWLRRPGRRVLLRR